MTLLLLSYQHLWYIVISDVYSSHTGSCVPGTPARWAGGLKHLVCLLVWPLYTSLASRSAISHPTWASEDI